MSDDVMVGDCICLGILLFGWLMFFCDLCGCDCDNWLCCLICRMWVNWLEFVFVCGGYLFVCCFCEFVLDWCVIFIFGICCYCCLWRIVLLLFVWFIIMFNWCELFLIDKIIVVIFGGRCVSLFDGILDLVCYGFDGCCLFLFIFNVWVVV